MKCRQSIISAMHHRKSIRLFANYSHELHREHRHSIQPAGCLQPGLRHSVYFGPAQKLNMRSRNKEHGPGISAGISPEIKLSPMKPPLATIVHFEVIGPLYICFAQVHISCKRQVSPVDK